MFSDRRPLMDVTKLTTLFAAASEDESTTCSGSERDAAEAGRQQAVAVEALKAQMTGWRWSVPQGTQADTARAPEIGDPLAPLPSIGSATHHTGGCRPCAWIWRPGGCSSGADCTHCHLCPEGELKARKKAKEASRKESHRGNGTPSSSGEQQVSGYEGLLDQAAAAKTAIVSSGAATEWPLTQVLQSLAPAAAAFVPPVGGDDGAPLESKAAVEENGEAEEEAEAEQDGQPGAEEEEAVNEEVAADLPSLGSAQHGAGMCRPCPWFWKPGGCANGFDCRHCHLCPQNVIKARKKERVKTLRQTRTTDSGSAEPCLANSQPQQPSLQQDDVPTAELEAMTTASAPVAVAETKTMLPAQPGTSPRQIDGATEFEGFPLSAYVALRNAAGANGAGADAAPEDSSLSPFNWQLFSSLPPGLIVAPPPGLTPAAGSPSLGSKLHGTGGCRPCGWFWRPGACSNGEKCTHCHLCPDGSVKARRKAKAASLKEEAKKRRGPDELSGNTSDGGR